MRPSDAAGVPPPVRTARASRWRRIVVALGLVTAMTAYAMPAGAAPADPGISPPAATTAAAARTPAAQWVAATKVRKVPGQPLRLSSAQFDRMSTVMDKAPAKQAAADAGSSPATSKPGAAGKPAAATAHASPSAAGKPDVSNIEVTEGTPATVAIPGRSDQFLRVYFDGDVGLVSANGSTVWDREPLSFWPDTPWKVSPKPGEDGVIWNDPEVRFTPSGSNPEDFSGAYAVGTVAGEAHQVVAVSHRVTLEVGAGVTDPPLPDGTLRLAESVVSLLDATTGATLWSREYQGLVMQLGFADGRLLVGNANGPRATQGGWQAGFGGPAGSVSAMDAWAFSPADSHTLKGARAWTYTVHSPWVRWMSLSQAGSDAVAVAWSDTPVGAPVSADGHVALLSDATGEVRWDTPTQGFPRTLKFDQSRNEVVALEELDPTINVGYALTGLRTADGKQADRITHPNAISFNNLQIGDVTGGKESDWVLTESDFVPLPQAPEFLAALVTKASVYSPKQHDPLWQSQVETLLTPSGELTPTPTYPEANGLLLFPTAHGCDVIVAASAPNGAVPSPAFPLQADNGVVAYSKLQALSGVDGHRLWDKVGEDDVYAPYVTATTYQGQPAIASINMENDLHVISAGTGTLLNSAPMFAGNMYASAGIPGSDGKPGQLAVGGTSGAVFALDATQLHTDPRIVWQADVGGAVHQISLVKLDPDGPPSLVVAATSKLVVLSQDGTVRFQVPFPAGQPVLSFATGAVGPGGATGIVVPTNGLIALDGQTGKQLWRYQPAGGKAILSNVTVSAKGTVTGEYAVPPAADKPSGTAIGPPTSQTAFGVHGTDGTVAWSEPFTTPQGTYSTPYLYNGVAAGTDIPGANGNGVAFTWELAHSFQDQGLLTLPWDQEQIDVRDADTGALLYSQHADGGLLAHWAYATGPGTGLADCVTLATSGVGPARLTPQTNSTCADIATARTEGGGRALLLTPIPLFGQRFGMYRASADYPSNGGTVDKIPNPLNMIITGVDAVDLNGAGIDHAVGLSYDMNAYNVLNGGIMWPGDNAVPVQPGLNVGVALYQELAITPVGIEAASLPAP